MRKKNFKVEDDGEGGGGGGGGGGVTPDTARLIRAIPNLRSVVQSFTGSAAPAPSPPVIADYDNS